jgi:hypothetical protein
MPPLVNTIFARGEPPRLRGLARMLSALHCRIECAPTPPFALRSRLPAARRSTATATKRFFLGGGACGAPWWRPRLLRCGTRRRPTRHTPRRGVCERAGQTQRLSRSRQRPQAHAGRAARSTQHAARSQAGRGGVGARDGRLEEREEHECACVRACVRVRACVASTVVLHPPLHQYGALPVRGLTPLGAALRRRRLQGPSVRLRSLGWRRQLHGTPALAHSRLLRCVQCAPPARNYGSKRTAPPRNAVPPAASRPATPTRVHCVTIAH